MLFTIGIVTFSSRGISSIQAIRIFSTITSLYVLNCFKHFLPKYLKIGQEKFWTYQVFMCEIVLNIFKYVFWSKYSKKISQEKKFIYVKMNRYSERLWTMSSLCVSKWLDIQKDFSTVSSGKTFQYSQIVYIKIISQ